MGVLDSVAAPPVVEEYNKDRGSATAEATATPTPKPPEKGAASPEPDRVSIPPVSKETNTEKALQQIGRLEEQRATMMPPKLQMPEKPKTHQDDIQLWGALGIAFAAIASSRTRTPMTTALNAAAASLNAMHDGQKEKADQAYKEWEEQSRIAIATAEYEQRAYKELMDSVTKREQIALAIGSKADEREWKERELQFKTLTAALKDPEMAQVYNDGMSRGGPQEAVKAAAGLYKEREKTRLKLKEATPAVVQAKIMSDAYQDFLQSKEYKEAVANNDHEKKLQLVQDFQAKMKGVGRGLVTLPPEELDKQADRVVKGEVAPPTPSQMFTRGGVPNMNAIALWDKIEEKASKAGFEYKEADYHAYRNLVNSLSGKAGDQIRSFTVLSHHLAFFDELSKQLQGVSGSDINIINKIVNKVSSEFGMPEITTFDAVSQVVSMEAVKAIEGGNIGALADRQEVEKNLLAMRSPEQLAGVSGAFRRLASGQLAGRLQEYKKFIERGWLKTEDIVPVETQRELGFTPDSSDKFIKKAITENPQQQEGGSGEVKIENIGSFGGDKKSSSTPEAEAMKKAPAGKTHIKPLAAGGYAYGDSEDGPWYDEKGNQIAPKGAK